MAQHTTGPDRIRVTGEMRRIAARQRAALSASGTTLLDGVASMMALERNAAEDSAPSVLEPLLDSDTGGRETLGEILGRPARTDWEREFHRLNDQVATLRSYARPRGGTGRMNPAVPGPGPDFLEHVARPAERQLRTHLQKRGVTLAAGGWWYTGTAGTAQGEEWTPESFSVTTFDAFRTKSRVARSLPGIQLLPGKSTTVPVVANDPGWRLHAEQTTASAVVHTAAVSNPGTIALTLDPSTHMVETGGSFEVMEDISPGLEALNRAIAASAGTLLDTLILNGQGTNDAGLDAALGPAVANGYGAAAVGSSLRHFTISATAGILGPSDVGGAGVVPGGGSALATTMLTVALGYMGAYAGNPEDCGIYIHPFSWSAIAGSATVTTLDRMGPAAVIIPGQVGSWGGIPIFTSDQIPSNLDANGKAHAVTTSTCAIVANRMRFRVGLGGIVLENSRQPGLNSTRVIGSVRSAFGAGITGTVNDTAIAIVNLLET